MEFVLMPAGEFDMGSPSNEAGRYDSEGPVHHVKISNEFYMGKYEVTQKQWRDVMGSSPSNFKGDNLPVEQVSWNDVQEFIKKLNGKEDTNKYRLLQRQNGNMRRALALPRSIRSVMMNRLATMRGLIIQAVKLIMLVRRNQIRGDSMTCMVMSGNGFRIIGMTIITTRRQMEVHGKGGAPTGLIGAAAGTTTPGVAGQRAGASMVRTPAATPSVFAF